MIHDEMPVADALAGRGDRGQGGVAVSQVAVFGALSDEEQLDYVEQLEEDVGQWRHVARVAEAKLDRSRRELSALRAACADLAGMTADVADVLRHELWVKYGVGLTPEQARDLSAQAVQVVAGRLDVESVQEAA